MYSATQESITVARGQRYENTDRVKNQSDWICLYVSTTRYMSTYTPLTTTTAIHRSKASVLVRKLAPFKCFEHAVERKLSGYKGNIPFHLHGSCYCYQENKQDTIFRRSRSKLEQR